MAKSDIGYKCEHKECGKWFATQRFLTRHQRCHAQKEKNFKCDYEGCKDAYFRNQHLQRHIKRVHSGGPGVFKCSEEGCTVSFDTKLGLKQHVNIKHSDPTVNRLPCSFCPQYFFKKWQAKEHEAIHTNLPPFTCSVCEENFKTYHEFKKHGKLQHTTPSSKKIHKCDAADCELVFEKWSALVEHKKTCHSSSKCKICDKVFKKFRLKQHMKVHEETREVFECTEEGCPRYYFFQRNLTQHIKSAHEGLSYACDLCNRKLSTKQKLSEHRKKWHKRLLRAMKMEPMQET